MEYPLSVCKPYTLLVILYTQHYTLQTKNVKLYTVHYTLLYIIKKQYAKVVWKVIHNKLLCLLFHNLYCHRPEFPDPIFAISKFPFRFSKMSRLKKTKRSVKPSQQAVLKVVLCQTLVARTRLGEYISSTWNWPKTHRGADDRAVTQFKINTPNQTIQ